MAMYGVRKFEDCRWSGYDQEMVERHRLALRLVEKEPVLDLGGGDGLFLTLLRQHKGLTHLRLLEISPVAVEKARQKGLDAETFNITERLPIPDKNFGTVCALDVLEHLYDPLPMLQEMGRIGETVVIAVPNFHYWKDRMRMFFGFVPFQCRPKRGHVYWFNDHVLREVTEAAGLRVETLLLSGFKRFGSLGPWLARLHPNLFADSFVVRLVANL